MIARAGSGWQTLLADLSIILFMVTAAALSQSGGGVQAKDRAQAKSAAAPESPKASARSEPLAVYRAGPGAPPLGQWLTAQSPDPRQQLSIVAHYAPGQQQAALGDAAALLAQAGASGQTARLVVEPGDGGTVATLAYDATAPGLAQGLHSALAKAVSPESKP